MTYAELQTLEIAYKRAVMQGDDYKAEHIAYLNAQAAYTGAKNDAIIEYLYPELNGEKNEGLDFYPATQEGQPANSAFVSAAGTVQAASQNGNEIVALSDVGTTSLDATTQTPLTGVITAWYGDYGYAGEVLVKRSAFRYQAMPLQVGDTITYELAPQGIEYQGRPRAVRVAKAGYAPAPRPAYERPINAEIAAQKAAARERKATETARKARQQANSFIGMKKRGEA
jgi:hypothetical protein